MIVNDTLWKWRDTAFTARKSPEREGIACALIAQRDGKLSSFTVADQPIDADALAKCSAHAK